MISLTRREFDNVSSDLTDAWLEARRRDRVEHLGQPRQDKARKQTDQRSHQRIIEAKPIRH